MESIKEHYDNPTIRAFKDDKSIMWVGNTKSHSYWYNIEAEKIINHSAINPSPPEMWPQERMQSILSIVCSECKHYAAPASKGSKHICRFFTQDQFTIWEFDTSITQLNISEMEKCPLGCWERFE